MQVPRWISNCTTEQGAWLHHKFDNGRGSNYTLAGSMELDAAEILEKHA